jgi:hypothetical protein
LTRVADVHPAENRLVLKSNDDCAALRDQDRVRVVTAQASFGEFLLRIPGAHITERELIHRNATSELFRGKWRSALVVVKRFHVTANQSKGKGQGRWAKGLRCELDVIGRLRYPCLLTLYGVTGGSLPVLACRPAGLPDHRPHRVGPLLACLPACLP